MKATLICAIFALIFLAACATPGPVPEGPPSRSLLEGTTARWNYLLGVSAAGQDALDEAQGYFEACLQKKAPSQTREACRWRKGWIQSYRFEWEQAVATWEELQRADPDFPKLAKVLADAKLQLAEYEKIRKIKVPKKAPRLLVRRAERELKNAFLNLHGVGDIMMGSDHPKPKFPVDEGERIFERVKPLLAGSDLVFGNLEGPLCDAGVTAKCSEEGACFAFRTPTRFGQHLKKAGFNVMSIANNHALDFGDECRQQTQRTLDSLGIRWSGSPGSVAILEVRGTAVALVGFHTSPFTNNANDLPAAKKMIREIRRKYPLVIVSFHGGAEGTKALHVPKGRETFYGDDRGELRTFAHAMVDAGASLVIGHGPHVLRGMEVYRRHLIAYSLGNFATYGRFNLLGFTSVGMVLDVALDAKGNFRAGRILPLRQKGEGIPVPDPEGRSIQLLRYLSREDFPATGVNILPGGLILPH